MINSEEILKIARLAKLSIQEDEVDAITRNLAKIIEFAKEIQKVEINSPDSKRNQSAENDLPIDAIEVLRDDVVENSFAREEILKNTKDTQDGYFCIGMV
jgi:aspartyl-tRNA(Asn)/glutamyl-tRNA(Gln) amidotransferase subunit C